MTSSAFDDICGVTHHSGYVFTPSEKVALQTAVPLLATRAKRPNVAVWGKLFGVKADYIVVQAFAEDMVEEPLLFYSIDEGLHFTLLGTASSLLASLASSEDVATNGLAMQQLKLSLLQKMQGPFLGDPSYEYRLSSDRVGEVSSVKESVRLALFVEEFDYQCRVAPRGAYYLGERRDGLPHEVRRNGAFTGLSSTPALQNQESAFSLHNYYHIRRSNPYRRLLDGSKQGYYVEKTDLQRLHENRQVDAVFDPLSDDIPTGLWVLHYDPMRKVVYGRNKKFEGALFYHRPETSSFGTLYMGEGTVNPNLAFEI
ncbi:radial spoke protein Ci-RSP9 [Angomonas deanei]|nr:radial spoke protein Ci-RSP9 [Angomonas deanei]|eukprot:EPY39611.1 radial spoke protein Ci-RSP9 [Angomonas deanei]